MQPFSTFLHFIFFEDFSFFFLFIHYVFWFFSTGFDGSFVELDDQGLPLEIQYPVSFSIAIFTRVWMY